MPRVTFFSVLLLLFSTTAFAEPATVQITLHDGLVSVDAKGATVSAILAEWQRVGGTAIDNADKISGAPLTIQLSNVTEEQALGFLLRTINGYVAVPRTQPAPGASHFARIIIMPGRATPPSRAQTAIPTPAAAAVSPAAAGPRTVRMPVIPAGIPQGGGVTRLVDANGQPLPDDQEGAPPRQQVPPPMPAPQFVPPPVPHAQQQPPPAQPTATPTAPANGAPVPGVIVQPPAPQPAAQQPSSGQPIQPASASPQR